MKKTLFLGLIIFATLLCIPFSNEVQAQDNCPVGVCEASCTAPRVATTDPYAYCADVTQTCCETPAALNNCPAGICVPDCAAVNRIPTTDPYAYCADSTQTCCDLVPNTTCQGSPGGTCRPGNCNAGEIPDNMSGDCSFISVAWQCCYPSGPASCTCDNDMNCSPSCPCDPQCAGSTGSCTVNGVTGACIDASLCPTPSYQSTPSSSCTGTNRECCTAVSTGGTPGTPPGGTPTCSSQGGTCTPAAFCSASTVPASDCGTGGVCCGGTPPPGGTPGRTIIPGAKIKNPLRCSNVTNCLQMTQGFMLNILTPIAVLAVMYAGFLFLTAGGNAERLTMAKRVILYVVLGSIIMGVAAGAGLLVTNLLN